MRDVSDLDRLAKEVKQDMRIAGVPYDQHCPIILSDYRMSRVLGQCEYALDGNKEYAKRIKINRLCFENSEEQDIKNIICHELIHSAKECVITDCGHKGIWKIYAEQMEEKYPDKYVIRRTTELGDKYYEALKKRDEEAKRKKRKKRRERKKDRNERKERPYKYEVYCPICGTTWLRKRKCKVVEYPNKYQCANCKVNIKVRVIGEKR